MRSEENNPVYFKTPDGSFVDSDGRVIFFSCERFVRDICEGDCCFICGASRSTKTFNDEHVLPEWLLRRYDLFNRRLTLPNGTEFRYDQYTIACCADCNSLMGKEIEEPISGLVEKGADAVYEYLKQKGPLTFFVWMGLIFLKTHLKDRHLRFNRDLRMEDGSISDLYSWENLHHIHIVARCFYSGCQISPDVIGSILVLPIRKDASKENFDFADLTQAQTMLLRLGDIAFVVVFNDSCGTMNLARKFVERIRDPSRRYSYEK